MPEINVGHLVYTRVEPKYSPEQRGGFQVVYASPHIRGDVSAIESRVQCFDYSSAAAGEAVSEYQYFWTPGGNAVVVQTVAIERDPEVIDSAPGRTGHFIAHALVMSARDFEMASNDPFAVLEAAERAGLFIENVDALVSLLQEEPPVERLKVKRRSRFSESLEGWTPEAVQQWALVAQSAGELTSQKSSLLLLSQDSDAIYALLSAALYLMDSVSRVACTFTTSADGCSPSKGTYWAVGGRKRAASTGFTTIDLDRHQIDLKQPLADPKASPYSIWLRQSFMKSIEISAGMPEIATAQIAAECLAAKRPLPEEPLLDTALITFREVNQGVLDTQMSSGLVALLGKSITVEIMPYLLQELTIHQLMSASLQEAFDASLLAPLVYRWALAQKDTIKAWGDLLKFGQAADYLPLIALAGAKAPSGLLGIGGNKNSKLSADALDLLAAAGQLPPVLNDLWLALRPDQLITPITAPILTSEIDLMKLDDATFVEFVVELTKKNGVALLDQAFVDRLHHMKDKKSIQYLAKALRKEMGVATAFTDAVQTADSQLP